MIKIRKLLSDIRLKLVSNSSFPFNSNEIAPFIKQNRDSVHNITQWISEETLSKSYFRYGVPDFILPKLDDSINEEHTYTDFIAYYGSKLSKSVNYLELGVSVGKNFYQLMNSFTNASLTGFDIENINPKIENYLDFKQTTEWKSSISTLRTENPYLKEYEYQSNKVKYLAGDIFDEQCWAKLKGQKFNIIFSDALHDPKALIFEFEMIEKYDLLADEFLFFWDDLHHGLENSFYKISLQLKAKYNLTKDHMYLVKVNGWLGQHEIKHDVGLITSLKLK